ncbi:MAG: chemotaxis protein CheW [Stenotrophobium sp.]
MSDQIYAVLIALESDALLLPNTAVAEVVPHTGMQPATAGGGWLLGHCHWNGQRVPVISFEMLNGAAAAEPGRRARIVIVHALSSQRSAGAIGILTQGHPHLVTLNRAALVSRPLRETDRVDLVLSRVSIANHEAAIPDLETIETDLMRNHVLSTEAQAAPAV